MTLTKPEQQRQCQKNGSFDPRMARLWGTQHPAAKLFPSLFGGPETSSFSHWSRSAKLRAQALLFTVNSKALSFNDFFPVAKTSIPSIIEESVSGFVHR